MHRADIEPAAAITGAIVAAVEPFGAKARTEAAIKGMPNRKNRRRLNGLQVQETRLRFLWLRPQQKEQNEKGDGAKDYHGLSDAHPQEIVNMDDADRHALLHDEKRCDG
jgi:hypothetical protein